MDSKRSYRPLWHSVTFFQGVQANEHFVYEDVASGIAFAILLKNGRDTLTYQGRPVYLGQWAGFSNGDIYVRELRRLVEREGDLQMEVLFDALAT